MKPQRRAHQAAFFLRMVSPSSLSKGPWKPALARLFVAATNQVAYGRLDGYGRCNLEADAMHPWRQQASKSN